MGSTGDGATPNSSEQYGTQDNPTRVTGQFLNGRGPDEVRSWCEFHMRIVGLQAPVAHDPFVNSLCMTAGCQLEVPAAPRLAARRQAAQPLGEHKFHHARPQ